MRDPRWPPDRHGYGPVGSRELKRTRMSYSRGDIGLGNEAGVHVVCQTDVQTARITHTAEDIDDALWWHAWLGASAAPRGHAAIYPQDRPQEPRKCRC